MAFEMNRIPFYTLNVYSLDSKFFINLAKKTWLTRKINASKPLKKNGPFWHLYTNGKDCEILFVDGKDFCLAINVFLRTVLEFKSIVVISYEFMSNHMHAILSGDQEEIEEFFNIFRRRLTRNMAMKGANRDFANFKMKLKPITNLKSMRNLICYVARNGYVVNNNYTPLSYPWGTGYCYFNIQHESVPCSNYSLTEMRNILYTRDLSNIWDKSMYNNHLSPETICNINLGMAMFRDAHQYFTHLSKNVEAFKDIALELGEINLLTDEEIFYQAGIIIKKLGASSKYELSPEQKLNLCKELRYKFNANNSQLRRSTGLSQYQIDILFPLGSKKAVKAE